MSRLPSIPNGTHTLSSTTTDTDADAFLTASLTPIPACIAAFARGAFLIVLDSPSRENEGDLIISAAHLTTSKAAFLIRHTSGYLCAPLGADRARLLSLPPMVPLARNADPNRTDYAVSVDATAAAGVTTGISAHDRAATARVLADPEASAQHLRSPGHLVPLVARRGGVRERRGHTEAGWELCRLAGLTPEVAVIGELVVDGVEGAGEAGGEGGAAAGKVRRRPEYVGSGMMRARECVEFGREWGIDVCTIEDLVAHVEAAEGPLSAE